MAGKGGGAWKVAYADFVTAMMAFFLVMWITAQNKAVKESIAQYFENPLGSATEARATSIHGIEGASAATELEGQQAGPHGSNHREPPLPPDGKVNEKLKGKSPALRIFERLGRLRDIGTVVQFPDEGMALDESAQAQLRALLPQLLGKPNKIELRGHAARTAPTMGPEAERAWEVCFRRCIVVMSFLEKHGIEKERFRLSQDGVFEPFSDETRPLNHPLNSRVEVYSISEFASQFKDSPYERAGEFTEEAAEGAAAEELLLEQQRAEAAAAAAAAKGEGHGGHGGGHGDSGHGDKEAETGTDKGHGGGHGSGPGKDVPAKDAHGKDTHGKTAHAKDSHGKEPASKGGHGKPAAAEKPAAGGPAAKGHAASGHKAGAHDAGQHDAEQAVSDEHAADGAAKKPAAAGKPAAH